MILDQFKLFIQSHPMFNGNADALLKRAQEFANTSCEGIGKGQFLLREHVEELLPDEAIRQDFLHRLTTVPYLKAECDWARRIGSAGS